MSAVKAVRSEATERRNKIIVGTAFAVVMASVLYFELRDPGPTVPSVSNVAAVGSETGTSNAVVTTPAGNVVGPAARTVGSTSAALDPTLHMQAMLVTESVEYTGSGRNIFAGPGTQTDIAAPIPSPLKNVRTTLAPPAPPAYRGPMGPPPPPPIELKFFGMVTAADGSRQAMLLHGDDVNLAANGDIVQRRYRVVNIGPNSIVVEDMTNNNRQTLPLQATP